MTTVTRYLLGLYLATIPLAGLVLLAHYAPLVLAGLAAALVVWGLVWLNVSYARDPLTPEEINELSAW